MGGLNITPVVRNLLIMNVAVFVAAALLNRIELFSEWFGLRAFVSPFFSPYQIFTYMFMHGGWQHLIFNMMGLIFLGPLLETVWGQQRFLFFFIFTGIGAGLVDAAANSYELSAVLSDGRVFLQDPTPENYVQFLGKHYPDGIFNQEQFIASFEKDPQNQTYIRETSNFVRKFDNMIANRVSVGASGAIFGLMTALGLLFPNTELMLLFLPIPIKAKYFVLLSAAFAVFMIMRRDSSDNVAHFAHLGGMLFAWILISFWNRQRTKFW